jgi:radical SAM superfamily enzyme YgiQ (UPF0313 family)
MPLSLSFGDLDRALRKLKEIVIECVKGKTSIVGFSSTFEQINATVLLSKALHDVDRAICQIAGGANCEGEMAVGQSKLLSSVDHIFSGESDDTFIEFISNPSAFLDRKVIYGRPKTDLEGMPCPDFKDYFEQLVRWLPNATIRDKGAIRLPYESSRGCWWGAKHHCTFCGLNGEGIGFRRKSADKVLREVQLLSEEFGVSRIAFTDNIMPHEYFKTLIPKLKGEMRSASAASSMSGMPALPPTVADTSPPMFKPAVSVLSIGPPIHVSTFDQRSSGVFMLAP